MSGSGTGVGSHSSPRLRGDDPVINMPRLTGSTLTLPFSLATPLSFLAVNGGAVYGYSALYQRVEEEEYGGIWELLKEGFMTSFALFLVSSLCTPLMLTV